MKPASHDLAANFDVGVILFSPAAALLLLAVLPAIAQAESPFTATGWITEVPVPGIVHTNMLGQVSLKGGVHIVRIDGDDSRITGRLQVTMDVAYQADGVGVFSGTAYHEVGTWRAVANNPTFTPSGGLWELSYRGLGQAGNSGQITFVGSGVGGVVDSLRLGMTASRGAGSILDPAIPYHFSGTIIPAPIDTTEVLDDFDDGKVGSRWTGMSSNGSHRLTETNGQFTLRACWPNTRTRYWTDTWAKGSFARNWTVNDGVTLEWRLDLVSRHGAASMVMLQPGNWPTYESYLLILGPDFLAIAKWMAGAAAIFSCDKVTVKNTNVVLSLAMTRTGTNLILTARLLDKDNQDAALHERSVVDTPQVDPSLTGAEFAALTGIKNPVNSDIKKAPLFSGDSIMPEIQQYTDGTLPETEATFDNLELRTYEVPPIGIQPVLRLSWPTVGRAYAVEAAQSLSGPWLPVRDVPTLGFDHKILKFDAPVRFFRLRPAP